MSRERRRRWPTTAARPRLPQPGRRAGRCRAVGVRARGRTGRRRSAAIRARARPGGRARRDRCAARAAPIPRPTCAAAERRGIRLVVPESTSGRTSRWPRSSAPVRPRAARARARRARRASEAGEPVPPLALWVRGDGGPGRRSAPGRSGIVGARAATDVRRARQRRAGVRAGAVAASWSCPAARTASTQPRTAARWPPTERRSLVSAGGLDRPYPAGNADAVRADRRERPAGLGEPAGLRAATAPLPDPQPADRRALDRRRGGRGRRPLGRGEHGRARPARWAGRVMAVPGPVTSAMSVGCHALLRRDGSAAAGDLGRRTCSRRSGRSAPAATRRRAGAPAPGRRPRTSWTGSTRRRRRVFEGLPPRRFAPPEEIAARSGVGVLDVIRALPDARSGRPDRGRRRRLPDLGRLRPPAARREVMRVATDYRTPCRRSGRDRPVRA